MSAFLHLIGRDLLAFKREFRTKFIDTFILFFSNIIAFGYLLRAEGVGDSFFAFFVVGVIGSFGFIEIVGKVGLQLADMHGDRTICHTLVMPIRSNMVFCYIAVAWALTAMIMSVLLFPIGKLFASSEWSFETISFLKLIPIFVTSNLFFGFFGLWLTGVIKDMTSLNSLWLRYIAPMWLFGGYTYSWASAYDFSPIFGYLNLINPMLYVMEGIRGATLGQEGYLPFWLCLSMLWVFILLCMKHGTHRLRRKLDCI